jgi:hypothetical protein
MSRMARNRIKWEEEQEKKSKEAEAPKPPDRRNVASRIFDTVNPLDSGRSWGTSDPSEEGRKKSWRDQAKDTGESLISSYKTLSTGAAEALASDSNDQRGVRNAQDALMEGNTATVARLTKELKKTKDEKKKARIRKAIESLTEATSDTGRQSAERSAEVADRVDPIKNAAALGSIGFDVLTAGTGANAAKLAGKKQVLGRMARAAAEGAASGGVSGGLGAVESKGRDTSLSDIAQGALTGAALGGAIGAGGGALSGRTPLDEAGQVMVPTKIKSKISDEVRSEIKRGKLDQAIQRKPMAELRLGVGTDTGEALNRATVDAYKDMINSGQAIDPVIVNLGEDGLEYIQDGAHRFQAAKELGVREIPTLSQKDNVVMAAKVEPPTVASLEAPINMRILNDLKTEAQVRSPGGRSTSPNQASATKVEQGASYIGADLERLAKETGIDVDPIRQDIAKIASDSLQGKVSQKTAGNSRIKSFANALQDSSTVAAKTVGAKGEKFVYNMLQGEKFKRDVLDGMRDDMVRIQKLSKKIINPGRGKKASQAAKIDLSKRIGAALDDRANAASYLKTPQEIELYKLYEKGFDQMKGLREKFGLEVLENYRPHVRMREASEAPVWLADSLTDKKFDTLSRFSKERVREEAADDVDDNIIDMYYGYVNSQLNEMAYDAPVRLFKKELKEMGENPSSRLNGQQFQEGIEYLATLTKQAVSPAARNQIEKDVMRLGSSVYKSVLPFNMKLTLSNKTQQWAANSQVSKSAIRLSKKMDDAVFDELENKMVFGDQTVFGQLEDMSAVPEGRARGFKDKVAGLDYYQKSEAKNIKTSYRKGVAEAVVQSDQYKAARASGMSEIDAMKSALQDDRLKELAAQRGNMVVNNTQFGASHIARPAALRSEGSLFGIIPHKALTMFTRFPIGMSQHVLETLDGKSARALDVLKMGDPRAVPIAEMRYSYGVLRDALKDSKSALDGGVDIGIPGNVLTQQIDTINKNIDIIDTELRKYSQIRSGKTIKNLAKMWGAAAGIQIIFDGGVQSFMEDPGESTRESIDRTNPTAKSMVSGPASKLGGVQSAALPFDSRGGINERALLNYVPGVGLAVNRGRDIKKLSDSLLGSDE